MKTLNLHINYDCPLCCRYCVQRITPSLIGKTLSGEQMIQKVQEFLDYINEDHCKVNISGGEPLLKYHDIQTLMEKFPKNVWEISTSGYLLTKEKAEYFSKFGVFYILSVDGTEKVTNYLRPLANGETGYFKKLKENIPHILYYSPSTRAKLIVSKNLIDEVYDTYLELERLGFKEIFITPNVYENEVDEFNPELKTGNWNDEDWAKFRNQIFKITEQIEFGLQRNKERCLITNITIPAIKLLFPDNEKKLNYKKMICEVLDYKGGASPEGGQQLGFTPVSLCVSQLEKINFNNQQELIQKAENDYLNLPKVCPKDSNCPYFSSCIYSTCLSENLKADPSNLWIPSPFQCKTQKIYHDMAVYFISCLDKYNNDVSKLYWKKIFTYHERMEE